MTLLTTKLAAIPGQRYNWLLTTVDIEKNFAHLRRQESAVTAQGTDGTQLPALAHLVTVLGSTRKAAATSPGVSSGAVYSTAWRETIFFVPLVLFSWTGMAQVRRASLDLS